MAGTVRKSVTTGGHEGAISGTNDVDAFTRVELFAFLPLLQAIHPCKSKQHRTDWLVTSWKGWSLVRGIRSVFMARVCDMFVFHQVHPR